MQCQKLKTYMETGRVVFLPPKAICPNPSQPRKLFREEPLGELAESIRQHGILQPLSVRRVGARYELIAGERRLRAGIQAGHRNSLYHYADVRPRILYGGAGGKSPATGSGLH